MSKPPNIHWIGFFVYQGKKNSSQAKPTFFPFKPIKALRHKILFSQCHVCCSDRCVHFVNEYITLAIYEYVSVIADKMIMQLICFAVCAYVHRRNHFRGRVWTVQSRTNVFARAHKLIAFNLITTQFNLLLLYTAIGLA